MPPNHLYRAQLFDFTPFRKARHRVTVYVDIPTDITPVFNLVRMTRRRISIKCTHVCVCVFLRLTRDQIPSVIDEEWVRLCATRLRPHVKPLIPIVVASPTENNTYSPSSKAMQVVSPKRDSLIPTFEDWCLQVFIGNRNKTFENPVCVFILPWIPRQNQIFTLIHFLKYHP